jgi:RecA DNA recombination protein
MAAALTAAGTAPLIAPPGVFKGRELTRKDRRLSAPMAAINAMLEGGIPRGRISEIIGRRSCGKTSLAAAFISSATRRGEVAAIIDLANAFDPATMAQAGVDLSRVLWASIPSPIPLWERARARVSENARERMAEKPQPSPQFQNLPRKALNSTARNFLRASETVLEAGGFGLLLMDFGESAFTLPQSSALRLARMAERSGTAVLILAPRPVCGTFAALSLDLACTRAIFSRDAKLNRYLKCISHPHPRPRKIVGEGTEMVLFEGMEIKASLRRNKIGRCDLSAQWRSLISSSDSNFIQRPSVPSPTSLRGRGQGCD